MKTQRWALALILVALPLSSVAEAQGRPTDPEFAEAVKLLGSGQADEALTVLDRVLARDPDEPWAWYQWGFAHHQAGRLDEALKGHMLSLIGAQPKGRLRAGASYNVACVHALQGRHDHAFQWLHRARLAGFNDAAGFAADKDLESLRKDPRFAALSGGLVIGPLDGARAEFVGVRRPGGTGGVACAADGTLFVSDFGSKVWRQRPGGEPELLAEGFTKAAGSAIEPDGALLQVDFEAAKVWRIQPDGSKEDLGLQGLQGPVGVARAEDGTLYMTDFRRRAVLRVPPGGQPEEIVAGTLLKGPNGICLAPTGDLYVCNYENGAVLKVDPKGQLSFVAELPGGGNGHLVWRDGALLVTARKGHAVYSVTPAGEIQHVVGSGIHGSVNGAGRAAQLALPNGIALSPDASTLYVNDQVQSGQYQLRAIHLPTKEAETQDSFKKD